MTEVLPVAYSCRTFAGVENKSGAPIATTIASDGCNIRAELIGATGQKGPCLSGARPVKDILQPRHGGYKLWVRSPSSNQGSGFFSSDSGNPGQNRLARGVYI